MGAIKCRCFSVVTALFTWMLFRFVKTAKKLIRLVARGTANGLERAPTPKPTFIWIAVQSQPSRYVKWASIEWWWFCNLQYSPDLITVLHGTSNWHEQPPNEMCASFLDDFVSLMFVVLFFSFFSWCSGSIDGSVSCLVVLLMVATFVVASQQSTHRHCCRRASKLMYLHVTTMINNLPLTQTNKWACFSCTLSLIPDPKYAKVYY